MRDPAMLVGPNYTNERESSGSWGINGRFRARFRDTILTDHGKGKCKCKCKGKDVR